MRCWQILSSLGLARLGMLTRNALTVATSSLAGSVTSVSPADMPGATWVPEAAAAAAAALLQADTHIQALSTWPAN